MSKKDHDKPIFRFDREASESDPVIDLFADEDEAADELSDEREADVLREEGETDGLQETAAADGEETERPERADEPPRYRFDRYGRRIMTGKEQYGKRKTAKKASTLVVRNETDAERQRRAAQARAEERAAIRTRKEEREREIRRAQKKAKTRTRLSTIVMGVLSVGVLLLMCWFTTRIRTIRFQPIPEGYTEEALLGMSGLEKGRSILFTDLKDAEARLEQDAYLEASVRYAFPSTVQVTLHKRTAVACVRWGPQNEYLAYIDENGIVVESEAEQAGSLLIVEGLSITSAAEGRRIGDASDAQVVALIDILSYCNDLGLLNRTPQLERIDLTELMSISIYTAPSDYSIELGDTSELATKLMLLGKHWDAIMSKADNFIRNGYSTATVYLYSKGGVTVSPYEPGYDYAAELVLEHSLATDPPEQTTFDPNAVAPNGTPDPNSTITPEPTLMPNQDDPFTG